MDYSDFAQDTDARSICHGIIIGPDQPEVAYQGIGIAPNKRNE
jgi:hypothetical protein